MLLKPTERIIVALNLIANELSIDYGNICSTSPMMQAKLINHKRVFLSMLPSQSFLMEVLSNLYIIHSSTVRQQKARTFREIIHKSRLKGEIVSFRIESIYTALMK